MNISVIGINHKTAPIEIREQFYLNALQQDLFLTELKCNPKVIEAFLLSTCNRTEVYLHLIEGERIALEEWLRAILQIKKLRINSGMNANFYVHHKRDCLKHLFEVVTGLDSLVLGEYQILGQVKEAFERSQSKGLFTKYFNVLANMVVRTGKKARAETDINYGGSSVSWAAIMMAQKILNSLTNRSALIIGAGKMSELAVEEIAKKELKKLYLMNRTIAHARELVEKYGGETAGFCDIKEILNEVDLCICCADAPHYILDLETIHKIKGRHCERPLVLIDISMPRNIDPRIASLENILLFDIDDLDKTLEESKNKRLNAVAAVKAIIDQKLIELFEKLKKLHSPDYSPRFLTH